MRAKQSQTPPNTTAVTKSSTVQKSAPQDGVLGGDMLVRKYRIETRATRLTTEQLNVLHRLGAKVSVNTNRQYRAFLTDAHATWLKETHSVFIKAVFEDVEPDA